MRGEKIDPHERQSDLVDGATTGGNDAMTDHVVVVGGGTGGTVLANRLADDLAPELASGEVRVTVVTASPDHVYKPTFLYVPFGEKRVDEGVRPVAELLDDRVDLRVERVTAVDTDARRLTLAGGERLGYDQLVLATGARLAPESVPGLVEGGHHFYGAGGAERLREALAGFDGGRLVLSVAGMPHMCPAAPVEFTLIAEAWLRERGLREESELVYTYPVGQAHALDAIAEWASETFAERGVEVHTGFEVTAVDPEERTVRAADDRALDYDLLVAIPPHEGSELVTDAGLDADGSGWVAVDQHTLAATNAENVHAIGDVADVPTSKAGSVAHYEAGVVADRIASRVRGRPPTATYDGKTVCFLESGTDEATYVSFHYGEQPVLREPSKYLHWSKLAYNENYWLTARGVL
jgi:sulfide:quinone oxidoreductase